MAVSLWEQALVAGIAAGAMALQSAIAAVRGRCFGSLGAMMPLLRGRNRSAGDWREADDVNRVGNESAKPRVLHANASNPRKGMFES